MMNTATTAKNVADIRKLHGAKYPSGWERRYVYNYNSPNEDAIMRG